MLGKVNSRVKNHERRILNIFLFIGIAFLVGLLVGNSASAKISVREVETKCGLFDCYTVLEIEGFGTSQDLINAKKEFITEKNTDVKNHKITADIGKNNWLNISGKIKGASKNKWNFTIDDGKEKFILDPFWNSSYDYRKKINIESNFIRNLTAMQLKFYIPFDSGMENDFSDFALTYYNTSTEAESEIPFWLESKSDGVYAYIWGLVPFLPNNTNTTLYLYFGCSGCEDKSNNTAVFTKEAVGYSAENYLVSRWGIDEGSDGVAYDSTNNANLSLIGNTAWRGSDGGFWDTRGGITYSGDSLDFDGNDDIASSQESVFHDITAEITLCGWVWFDGSPGANSMIIAKTDKAQPNKINYHFGYLSGGTQKLTFCYHDGSYHDHLSSVAPSMNQWVFLGVTYNGDRVKIYIDGSLDSNQSAYSGSLPLNNANISLGATWNGNTIGEELNGYLDEWRIYNKSLSEFEITAIYERRQYSEGNFNYFIDIKESQIPEANVTVTDEYFSEESANNIFIFILFLLFAMPLLIVMKNF